MARNYQKAGWAVSVGAGFTLIELLVVIGIIALLMGIVVPVANRVRGAAKSTVCRANLRSIGMAFRMYFDDNQDMLPPAAELPIDAADRLAIMQFLERYLKQAKVFKCPGDPGAEFFRSLGTSYKYTGSRYGGQVVSKLSLISPALKERNVDIMADMDPFHGRRGKVGSFNYLYADGHVGDSRAQ